MNATLRSVGSVAITGLALVVVSMGSRAGSLDAPMQAIPRSAPVSPTLSTDTSDLDGPAIPQFQVGASAEPVPERVPPEFPSEGRGAMTDPIVETVGAVSATTVTTTSAVLRSLPR